MHLVAHDFGGPFALTWAAAHTDRVASVTLINTGVLIDYRWHRLAKVWRIPVLGELFMRATTDRVARLRDAPRQPWPTRANGSDRIAGHLMPRGTKRAVLRLYRSTTSTANGRAESNRCAPRPGRAGGMGRRRRVPPGRASRAATSRLPRVRIEMLPGVGHWAWLEQPDRVAELVVPFLCDRVGKPTLNNRPRQGHSYERHTGHHPRQFATLAARPADAPVLMVNLLQVQESPAGLERYLQYGAGSRSAPRTCQKPGHRLRRHRACSHHRRRSAALVGRHPDH